MHKVRVTQLIVGLFDSPLPVPFIMVLLEGNYCISCLVWREATVVKMGNDSHCLSPAGVRTIESVPVPLIFHAAHVRVNVGMIQGVTFHAVAGVYPLAKERVDFGQPRLLLCTIRVARNVIGGNRG